MLTFMTQLLPTASLIPKLNIIPILNFFDICIGAIWPVHTRRTTIKLTIKTQFTEWCTQKAKKIKSDTRKTQDSVAAHKKPISTLHFFHFFTHTHTNTYLYIYIYILFFLSHLVSPLSLCLPHFNDVNRWFQIGRYSICPCSQYDEEVHTLSCSQSLATQIPPTTPIFGGNWMKSIIHPGWMKYGWMNVSMDDNQPTNLSEYWVHKGGKTKPLWHMCRALPPCLPHTPSSISHSSLTCILFIHML